MPSNHYFNIWYSWKSNKEKKLGWRIEYFCSRNGISHENENIYVRLFFSNFLENANDQTDDWKISNDSGWFFMLPKSPVQKKIR